MKLALCPGSFDPITVGHLDIIHRAAELFDHVVVLVSVNVQKNPIFTREERVALIERCISDLPNVSVDTFGGLLADYAKEHNAVAIVKGLRAVTDFENEFQMALVNQKLCPNTNTVFLNSRSEYMYLSSSMVRQIASFGGDIREFIPSQILDDVAARLTPSALQMEK